MIIDSHAHYNNNAYKKPFRYLTYGDDGYALKDGDREQLFQELLKNNLSTNVQAWVDLLVQLEINYWHLTKPKTSRKQLEYLADLLEPDVVTDEYRKLLTVVA